MMLRNAGILLFVLASGAAAIPAEATGDNVVLISVTKVALPSQLPGLCNVSGIVSQVWDGKSFHVGSSISLNVPCGSDPHMTPATALLGQSAATSLIAADVLLQSKEGFARIDDAGQFIWQYSKRAYGPWGVAGGYRVLDGAAVPATPERANP